MGTFIGLTIYVPIFLEGVIGLTASESGVALVPLMVGTVTGATLSGRSMLLFRHYKRLPLAMMSVSITCCAIIALEGRALPFWLMEVMLALLSMGIGTILPLSTIAIQNAVEPHQLGIATAAMNFFRSLGGALIVAAFGTIVLGGAAGTGHDVESLIRGADPAHLALTFRSVFLAACLGLMGAFAFLAYMEERPLGERPAARTGAPAADTPT
jgi:MFS family permease